MQALPWEADITHNGHERVVAIVKEIGGVIEDRIRVGDRREDSQSLIVGCPHWFQFKSNEIPQNRLSLRWVGSANYWWDIAVKGLEHSNTNRIERFVIGAISSSLKEPFSNIRYRLQLLAEGKRELYRYRGDESTHASIMWKGNRVVVCTNREYQFSSKKNALDPSNRYHGISGCKTSNRYNPFTFHVNSSLSELSQSMSTTGSWLGSITGYHSNRIEGITTITD